jgi:CRP-like cAMP-binding protein
MPPSTTISMPVTYDWNMPSEHDVAFPRLSRTQIDALRRWGHVRPIAPGDVLFQEGDRGFSFYVVLEGAVEIVERSRVHRVR